MSFNFTLFTLLIMDANDDLRVITYLDYFGKVITYLFDGVPLKLALISGIINVLKYIITSDTQFHATRLKVISEALFVSIIMYNLTYLLLSNNYPIYVRNIVAVAVGMSGYSFIEKTLKLLVDNFISKLINKNSISQIDKKDK